MSFERHFHIYLKKCIILFRKKDIQKEFQPLLKNYNRYPLKRSSDYKREI